MKLVALHTKRVLFALIPALVLPAGVALLVPAGVGAQVLEEVVVTARRREEQLQDVPISIQALTTEDLELRGIESGVDLSISIPNLAIGNSFVNDRTLITLRGVPNVGVYVDGIWQQSAGLYQSRIVELERVEVMRGPQGTLFGRNTNGGAIQYTTARPAEEFRAKISGTIGSYNRQDVKLAVDLPFSDTLLTKWVLASMNSDGWLESLAVPGRAFGGRDDTVLRGDIIWRPSDDFDLRLTVNSTETNNPAARQARWSTQGLPPGVNEHFRQTVYNIAMLNPAYGPFDFWEGPLPEGTNRFPIREFSAYTHDPEYPGGLTGKFQNHSTQPLDGQQYDNDQFTLTATWNINDNLTLTSLTAQREQSTRGIADFFASEITFALTDLRLRKSTLFSEELHLEGIAMDGKIDYLVGLYYSDEEYRGRHYRWGMHEFFVPDENGNPTVDTELRDFVRAWGMANGNARLSTWRPVYFYNGGINDPITAPNRGRTQADLDTTEEYALFGEVGWNPNDRLTVTGGLRFAWNDGKEVTLDATEAYRSYDPPIVSGGAGRGPGDPFTGTVFREEDDFLTTDVVVTPAVSIAYDWTENIMTYARYAEGFTRGEENFNSNLQQVIALDPEVVENIEVGLRSDLLDNRMRLNFSIYRMIWNGLRVLKQFPTPDGDLVLATVSGGKARAQGVEGDLLYALSDDMQLNIGFSMNDTTYLEVGVNSPLTPNTPWGFAPKYNANLGLQYDRPVGNGGNLTLRGDIGYTSDYQMDPAIQRQAPQNEPAYSLVNARLRYTPPQGDWSVSVFGANLTDERYITGGIDAGQLWGIQFLDIGKRRTYGVQLDVDFGR